MIFIIFVLLGTAIYSHDENSSIHKDNKRLESDEFTRKQLLLNKKQRLPASK